MDERIKLIAEKEGALCHIEITRLKEERFKLEAMPEPEKVNLFEQEIAEMEKALQAEVSQTVANIVQQAAQNIHSVYSPGNLLEQAKTVYRKEASKLAVPDLMLRHLHEFKKALQHQADSHNQGIWNNRLKTIDENIKSWTAKIPVPFSPDLINKNERFPHSRCGMVDKQWVDLWLTDLLHSKPVLFSAADYKDKLVEVYHLYVKEHEKEQAAANKQALAQEAAIQAAKQEQPNNVVSQREIHDPGPMWEHPEGSNLWQGERFRR